jgi:transcription-repair coupling factor (superfamily II helicase)
MKLVARMGPAPATPAAPARPAPPARGPTGKKLAHPKPPPPSPAQEAIDGRAVLQAARELLAELARCARPE